MNKKFIIVSLSTSVVLFVLNAIAYLVFLKNFFQSHPAVSSEFMKQLYRPDEEIILWAMILSALGIGFLVTIVIQWSGAKTFLSGLKSGFIFAFLFLCTVDFGLLATTNNFTTAGAFADLITSTITITLSCAFAAWMLGYSKK